MKRRVLISVALALALPTFGAVNKYRVLRADIEAPTWPSPHLVIADTEVELFAEACPEGSIGYAKNTSKAYRRTASEWRETGAVGGGGGTSQLVVSMVADGAAVAYTNQAAAASFFAGSHRYAKKLDLTNYTQVRLIVNKQATAGAANAKVRLRYSNAFSTTVGNWLAIGTSEVQVAVNVQNTVLDSGWINLAAGARGDVFVTLDGIGGDGVLDPAFGAISAQFR
jgi:hypothetical protein